MPNPVNHPIHASEAPAHLGREGFWCEHPDTDRAGIPVSVDSAGLTTWEPMHIKGTCGSVETTPTADLLFWQQAQEPSRADEFRALRKQLGLTQRQIALLLDRSHGWVRRVEYEEIDCPRYALYALRYLAEHPGEAQ